MRNCQDRQETPCEHRFSCQTSRRAEILTPKLCRPCRHSGTWKQGLHMRDSNNIGLIEAGEPGRDSWANADDALHLQLCMRLLTCSTLVENSARSLMRGQFGSTLPRFDLMAHLATAPRGMRMSDLSLRMMVTNGNITGIVDQLERDGLVERLKVDSDRRSSVIRLTPEGRQTHRRMSATYKE